MVKNNNTTNQGHVDDVIAYVIVEVVIAFLALCSNSLVLAAIFRFKNLQSTTYKLIGSLAVADMAVALLANSSGIVLRLNLPIKSENSDAVVITSPSLDQELCSLFMCLVLILTQVSIWNLLAIAIDRFIAIYFALRYKSIVTPVCSKLCIIATWTCSVIAITPHIDWYVTTFLPKNTSLDQQIGHCAFEEQINLEYMVVFNFFVFMLLPLFIMLILYYCIFRSAKMQLRKIYWDVLTLNKKSKHSLTSLRDILIVKEQIQQSKAAKHTSLRKQMLRVKQKFQPSKSDQTTYRLGEILNDSNSVRECSVGNFDNNNKGISSQQAISTEIVSETSMTSEKKNSFDSASFDIESTNFSQYHGAIQSKSKEADFQLVQEDERLQKLSSSSNLTNNAHLNASETDLRKKKLKRKSQYLKKEFRAARSLFLVLFAFALCWLPLHIHNAIHYFNPQLQQPAWFADFAIILSHTNSFVNPVIYAFRLREMRSAFKRMFLQLWHHFKPIACRCFASNFTPSNTSF